MFFIHLSDMRTTRLHLAGCQFLHKKKAAMCIFLSLLLIMLGEAISAGASAEPPPSARPGAGPDRLPPPLHRPAGGGTGGSAGPSDGRREEGSAAPPQLPGAEQKERSPCTGTHRIGEPEALNPRPAPRCQRSD